MRRITCVLLFSFCCFVFIAPVFGQMYFTKNGRISFFSKTVLENIKADNNQVISVLDVQTGVLQFSLFNRAFDFPKAKMEEDFNESYMESAKFPKSTFKGTISHFSNINFSQDGVWDVNVTGDLTVHGITHNISVNGKIVIKNSIVEAHSDFKIFLKDYDIKIPSIVSNKISESIIVTVDCVYQKK